MSSPSLFQIVRAFNSLPRPRRTPSGQVPNHWHISIRRVPFRPPGHLVFLVQPDSHYVHTQGPIEKALGKALGDFLDLEDDATVLVIVRHILQSFVNQSPPIGRPWSWCINDEANMGVRIIGLMRRLKVDEALMDMPAASAEQNASSDQAWEAVMGQLGNVAT